MYWMAPFFKMSESNLMKLFRIICFIYRDSVFYFWLFVFFRKWDNQSIYFCNRSIHCIIKFHCCLTPNHGLDDPNSKHPVLFNTTKVGTTWVAQVIKVPDQCSKDCELKQENLSDLPKMAWHTSLTQTVYFIGQIKKVHALRGYFGPS